MDVEGPLPPGIKSGIGGTTVADVGPLLVGSIPTTMCVVVMGPLEGIPVMMGGKDVGPPPTMPPWKGYRCVPVKGIDGVVNKVGLDW